MRRRRGRGEGSIVQRADGRWMGRVDLGYVDGKRVRRAVYGRTCQAVASKVRKALEQAEQGIPFADERQTVGQYVRSWLALKRAQLRPRTFASYEHAICGHVGPGPVAKIRLAKLTPQQISAWFQAHQAAGASARTIRYIRAVLRAALNQALRWGLVGRNAAALVEVPRHRTRDIQPLTPEQARTLLASVTDHRLGAIVSVATALGLRIGEALGLRWQDVDFDAGTLRVQQSLERSGGDRGARRPLVAERRELLKRFNAAPKRSAERRKIRQQINENLARWRETRTTIRFAEPKSPRSRRTIRMPQVVVSALKAHRTRQLEERLAAAGLGRIPGSCSPRRSARHSIRVT